MAPTRAGAAARPAPARRPSARRRDRAPRPPCRGRPGRRRARPPGCSTATPPQRHPAVGDAVGPPPVVRRGRQPLGLDRAAGTEQAGGVRRLDQQGRLPLLDVQPGRHAAQVAHAETARLQHRRRVDRPALQEVLDQAHGGVGLCGSGPVDMPAVHRRRVVGRLQRRRLPRHARERPAAAQRQSDLARQHDRAGVEGGEQTVGQQPVDRRGRVLGAHRAVGPLDRADRGAPGQPLEQLDRRAGRALQQRADVVGVAQQVDDRVDGGVGVRRCAAARGRRPGPSGARPTATPRSSPAAVRSRRGRGRPPHGRRRPG